MSEYTPTTDEIREYVAYGDWGTEEYPVEEFDRWLAKHDAEVKRAAAERERVSIRSTIGAFQEHGVWAFDQSIKCIDKARREEA